MHKNSELIHFSRAGDKFHYRWAVKRCLQLLDFDTNLTHITIEGSQEPELDGECVVDMAEYRRLSGGQRSISYFQLKHTTAQQHVPFTLSHLKSTFRSFANRFKAHKQQMTNDEINFYFISNRLVAENIKLNLSLIGQGREANETILNAVKDCTRLGNAELQEFCSQLRFCDSEGDYDEQKFDIHKELVKISVFRNVSDFEKLLVDKVWEKVEPGKSNTFTLNDILQVFDITDPESFFPARPHFEPVTHFLERTHFQVIADKIRAANAHTAITAIGGMGKSILSANLHRYFDDHSIVIAYDCYGNGSYRRASEKRHKTGNALVQIINTLAKEGLCDMIIPGRHEPDEFWIRAFLQRVEQVCCALSDLPSNPLLVFIFDAADNSEMAAAEYGDTGFAKLLLREKVPDNCRLVFTCRPEERLAMLEPPANTNIISIPPLNDKEAMFFLQNRFKEVSVKQAEEFNQLTFGNPRVQANALAANHDTPDKLLFSFGGTGVTVEDLIERQLDQAINEILDLYPINYREQITSICRGLTMLPPFVPIGVLATVAGVSESAVRSFVADLGRPLWLSESSVQFRDEPTEKWFLDRFSADSEQIGHYIELMKPLSADSPYVAESLPILLLKAQRFDELVSLAISEDFLPVNNTFEQRTIRLFRLQFAFKAALNKGHLRDACKLALRAGEELASVERQDEILRNHLDIAKHAISASRLEGIARRKEIFGNWDGSETIYSASILASFDHCQGDARSYLRSGIYWMDIHYEKRQVAQDSEEHFDEEVEDIDLVEIASAILDLDGVEPCVRFLLWWHPPECIFRVVSMVLARLIDKGELDIVNAMISCGKGNPAFVVAAATELLKIGKTPARDALSRCLNKIISPKSRLEKPGDYFNNHQFTTNAFLSFFEACLLNDLPPEKVRRGVNYYYKAPYLSRIADHHQYDNAIANFLRYTSIKTAIKGKFNIEPEHILEKEWIRNEHKDRLSTATATLGRLLPWYLIRAKLLRGIQVNFIDENAVAIKVTSKFRDYQWRPNDPFPYEQCKVRFNNLLLCKDEDELDSFINDFEKNKIKAYLNDEIEYLRASSHNEELLPLSELLEASCHESMKEFDVEESPETLSDNYIKLSRAILSTAREDALAYFSKALFVAAKTGNESYNRWNALCAAAQQSSLSGKNNPELAYRFMRSAEMIGQTIGREKYWDRNEALDICYKLSPESAFATAQRWKDRNVGWHERLIEPLVNSALESGHVNFGAIWSFSAFSWEHGLTDLFIKCVDREPDVEIKQEILNQYITDLRNRGVRGDDWAKISEIAEKHNLKNEALSQSDALATDPRYKATRQDSNSPHRSHIEEEGPDWNEFYGQYNLLTEGGFLAAFNIYDSNRIPQKSDFFWKGCLNKVGARQLAVFISIVAKADFLHFLDIRDGFDAIPSEWKKRPSVESTWNNIISFLASRFPRRFTQDFEREYHIRPFILNHQTHQAINDGVFKGLSESVDIESHSTLFSFVEYGSSQLTPNEAAELTEFGLARFEEFIEPDFADGPWCSELSPPTGVSMALAAFIYANLGSPYASERWRAVHTVIRLYRLKCDEEIGHLVRFLEEGSPTAFVPPDFDFYEKHASLYLVVALSRCSKIASQPLLNYKNVFVSVALNREKGVIYRFYARQICLNLAADNRDCFDSEILADIKAVCTSHLPEVKDDRYKYLTDSIWHQQGLMDNIIARDFGHDFENYWFRPLGNVFGISPEQIAQIATYILHKKWGGISRHFLFGDKRKYQGTERRNSYRTFGYKDEYPDIDNLSFYSSWHLMMEVASLLLENMPCVRRRHFDGWEHWLETHLIIGDDKFLLAELRDPIPIDLRQWTEKSVDENWRWQTQARDFFDVMYTRESSGTWLNINGNMKIVSGEHVEEISFTTVLVPKKLSQSLLISLETYEDYSHECYLSAFCRDDEDFPVKHGFNCVNWLVPGQSRSGRESNDPFSAEIIARNYELIEELQQHIELYASVDHKTLFYANAKMPCLQNIFWSEDKEVDRDSNVSFASFTRASIKLLTQICSVMDMELAIEVAIERNKVTKYRSRKDNDEISNVPRSSKTFILSSDGRFRDLRKSYPLG